MARGNFLQFKIFKKYKNLVHGVFPNDFGNVDFRFGHKKQVLENRKKIADVLGFDFKNLWEMEQVHGSEVRILGNPSKKAGRQEIRKSGKNVIPATDGLITDKKNAFLMIKTADCFPVLMYDPKNKVVGAVHVGWRGAIQKIFLKALLQMIDIYGCQAKNVLVGIGPGIGQCCFKHKKLVQEKLPEWQQYINIGKNNIKSLDIAGFIINQLTEAGIKKQHIEDSNICTSCSNQFYSHFKSLRKRQTEGRFATIIGIK